MDEVSEVWGTVTAGLMLRDGAATPVPYATEVGSTVGDSDRVRVTVRDPALPLVAEAR